MRKHRSIFSAFLFLVFFFVILVQAAPVQAADPAFVDGYYQIVTPDDLIWFRDHINDGSIPADSNAKLTADIVLPGNWQPIGQVVSRDTLSGDFSYNGTFDGGGHKVSGLVVLSADAADYYVSPSSLQRLAGLFGVTSSDAVIQNLTVENAEIDVTGLSYAAYGVVVGRLFGTVRDCAAVGGSVIGNSSAGGIAGYVGDTGSVVDCTAGGIEKLEDATPVASRAEQMGLSQVP